MAMWLVGLQHSEYLCLNNFTNNKSSYILNLYFNHTEVRDKPDPLA